MQKLLFLKAPAGISPCNVLDAVTSLKASSVDLGRKVESFLAEIDAA